MVKLFTQSIDRSLAGIVRHDLPKVVTQRRKFQAFKDFGQFTEAKARAALQPGSGPVLTVSSLRAGLFGEYRGGDEIRINVVITNQHQTILDAWSADCMYGNRERHREHWLALVKKATLIVESIILHEAVHWGDLKADGEESDDEAVSKGWKDLGHMFVHQAYGSQFAVERERLNRRTVVKRPQMDIEGWMGWGVAQVDGRSVAYPYDPWYGRGPASGPVAPPH